MGHVDALNKFPYNGEMNPVTELRDAVMTEGTMYYW